MKNIIPLVAIIFTFITDSARAQNDTVLITEVRYANHMPLPWDPSSKFVFYWISPDHRTITMRADPKEKETYYERNRKGTEIVLHFPPGVFDRKIKQFTIHGTFSATPDGTSDSHDSKEKTFNFNLTRAVPLNQYAYKAYEPIEITEPEVFSLITMTNYINRRLNESSTTRDGFAGTVDALNKFKDDYYDDRKIKFDRLLDFFKLYEFLDEYAPDQSFYNQEAKALYTTLENANSQSRKSYLDTAYTMEQAVSNQVYREYVRTYAVIRDYNSRLQLILFFKSR